MPMVLRFDVASSYWRPPRSSCDVQLPGPGSRVQDLLGLVALEEEQVYKGTSANTGFGTVTLLAILTQYGKKKVEVVKRMNSPSSCRVQRQNWCSGAAWGDFLRVVVVFFHQGFMITCERGS